VAFAVPDQGSLTGPPQKCDNSKLSRWRHLVLGLAGFRISSGGELGKGRQRNKPEGGSGGAFEMLADRDDGCVITGSHERPMC
jgi:hypothetical protein